MFSPSATPASYGDPHLVDETLEPFDLETVSSGDVVGIGIHTANAHRGYEIGRIAREKGAWVVFGGIHPTLFPEEAREHGQAHAIVRGDGDLVWGSVIADCAAGQPKEQYEGGRVAGRSFFGGRWDMLPERLLHVRVGADRARLSEALLVLLGLADRRPGGAHAKRR